VNREELYTVKVVRTVLRGGQLLIICRITKEESSALTLDTQRTLPGDEISKNLKKFKFLEIS
jgi:hypothetical protein